MSVIPAISNRNNENTKTYGNSNNQNPTINNLITVPAGIAAGSASAFAIKVVGQTTVVGYLFNLFERIHDVTVKGFPLRKIADFANKMVDENIGKRKNGIIPKELSFSYSTPENLKQTTRFLKQQFEKSREKLPSRNPLTFLGKIFKKASDLLVGKLPEKITLKKLAKEACYIPIINHINVPNKHRGCIFHEIGHAINKCGNFFSKLPFRADNVSKYFVLPALIFTAMFTGKGDKENKEKQAIKQDSFFKKSRQFIKDHIGALTFASFIPCMIEEARASAHAVKFINKQGGLSKAFKAGHSKFLQAAFLTYLALAAITALSVKAAVSVKDKTVDFLNKKLS